MPFDGDVLRVKILVKEHKQTQQGNRIYLVQALEIEKPATHRGQLISFETDRFYVPAAGFDDKIQALDAAVKGDGVSRVVDENGEPLVVYHGTQIPGFNVFNTPAYFSSSAGEVGMYAADQSARMHRWRGLRTDDEFDANTVEDGASQEDRSWWEPGRWYVVDDGVFRKTQSGEIEMSTAGSVDYDFEAGTFRRIPTPERKSPGTHAVYLRIENPAHLPHNVANRIGGMGGQIGVANRKLIADLQAKGHDGVIAESDWGLATNYIVFDTHKIKSATGNQGTFSPAAEQIHYSVSSVRPWPKGFRHADMARRAAPVAAGDPGSVGPDG